MQAQAPDHFANVHVGRLSPFRLNNNFSPRLTSKAGSLGSQCSNFYFKYFHHRNLFLSKDEDKNKHFCHCCSL